MNSSYMGHCILCKKRLNACVLPIQTDKSRIAHALCHYLGMCCASLHIDSPRRNTRYTSLLTLQKKKEAGLARAPTSSPLPLVTA